MNKSNYELYLGDTIQVIKNQLNDKEIDMIFTSPPYFDLRKNYSGKSDGVVGNVSPDEYADWFLNFTESFLNVLTPNGSFFLNINDKIIDGEVHPVIDELKMKMRKQGWKLVAKPYIWYKKQAMPSKCTYRAIDRYEYVFHFSNTTTPKFYPENCKVPYAKSTIKRFDNPVPTIGSRDGELKYVKKEANEGGSLPHNVVTCAAESNPSILHPAPFTVELADWFVKIGSKVGDTVLDPFCGSGSSGIASLKNDRNFVGIDLMEFNIEFSEKRFEHFLDTGNEYIAKKLLESYGLDINHYKVKGKHENFK